MKTPKNTFSKLLMIGLVGGLISCVGEQVEPDVEVDTDGDGIFDHQESNGYYYLDGEFFTLERVMSEDQWLEFSQNDEIDPPQNKRTPFKLTYDVMNNNNFAFPLGNSEVSINFDGLLPELSTAFKKEYGDTHPFSKSGSNVPGSYKNLLLRLNQNYSILEPIAFNGDVLPYYFTNPDLPSSDRDPYSDYDEVVNSFIMGNVTKVHPSIAAFPVIEATLEGYTYVPDATIEDSQGREISSSVSHSVESSTSQTDSWEASVSVTGTVSFVPSVEVSVSASVGGSYTSSEVVSDSNENSEGFSWESATTTNTLCAANITFDVALQNTGSAPAEDVELLYQVRIGSTTLPAFSPEFALDLPANGIPIANNGALTYDAGCISINQLQYLQLGGAIELETIVNTAKIPYLGGDDELIEFGSEWLTYISMAMLQNAKLHYSVFDQNDDLFRNTFYVDPKNRHKVLTLRDAIKSTLDIPCDEQQHASFCINMEGDIVQSPQTYVGIIRHGSDNSDAKLDELLGNNTNVLDIKLEPMWEYHIITTTSDTPTIRSVNLNIHNAEVEIVARVTDELGIDIVQFCETTQQCFDMAYNSATQLYTYTPEAGRIPTGDEFLNAVNSRNNNVTTPIQLPSTWNSQISVMGKSNTHFGSWSGWAMCPTNTYAKGFRLKVEGVSFDDTALNRISLICSDKNNTSSQTIISGGDTGWGNWGNTVNCNSGEHLLAFNIRSEAYQGLDGDDSGANAIRFTCGGGGAVLSVNNEGPVGSWGGYQSVNNTNYRICGVRSQIEANQGFTDDTALNNVEFRYCDYSGIFN